MATLTIKKAGQNYRLYATLSNGKEFMLKWTCHPGRDIMEGHKAQYEGWTDERIERADNIWQRTDGPCYTPPKPYSR